MGEAKEAFSTDCTWESLLNFKKFKCPGLTLDPIKPQLLKVWSRHWYIFKSFPSNSKLLVILDLKRIWRVGVIELDQGMLFILFASRYEQRCTFVVVWLKQWISVFKQTKKAAAPTGDSGILYDNSGFSGFTKHQNHLQGLLKHILLGFPFWVSDPVCLGLNLRICLSDIFSGTDAAGPGIIPWKPLPNPNLAEKPRK